VTTVKLEDLRTNGTLDRWVHQLIDDPEFRHGNRHRKRAATRKVTGQSAGDPLLDAVVDEARRALDDALGPRVRQMRADGMSKEAIRITLGITGSEVTRYLLDP
jgi:DNA invertase Pin-like site-specific DNA recombinase